MKINNQKRRKLACLFSTSGHSGVDRVMANLIPAIASRGVDVDLLRVRNHGPYIDELPDNVRIIDLGVSHTIPAFPSVMRYLKQNEPDVLLSDKDKVNRLAYFAKILAGVNTRLVFRFGITISKYLESRSQLEKTLHYISMHYLYPKVSSIVVPSDGVASDMAQFAEIPRSSISVINNPLITDEVVNMGDVRLDHRWFSDPDISIILGVGELCERKGFDDLIRAFARIYRDCNCRLVILGRGRLQNELEKLCQELNVYEFVDFLGFQENPYVYMKNADVFVSASHYEGFGNVIVEAMSVGTPVVATDCPSGPREILRNGKFGSLVPVNNVVALADAIVELLDNPTPESILIDAASDYHIDKITSRYIDVLGLRDEGKGSEASGA